MVELANSTEYPFTPNPFELYWYGVTVPILVLFGTFGNIMLVVIIARGDYWKRLKVYLIILGIVDTFLLPNALLMYPVRMWFFNSYPDGIHLQNIYMQGTRYIYGCLHFCLYAHLWVTAAITIERFLAICYPIWHKGMDTERLVWTSVGIAVGISFGCAIPRMFEVELQTYWDVGHNNLTVIMAGHSPYTQTEYYQWVKLVLDLVSNLVPVLILVGLSCRIMIQISRHSRMRARQRLIIQFTQRIDEKHEQLSASRNPLRKKTVKKLVKKSGLTEVEQSTQYSLLVGLLLTLMCYTLPIVLDIIEMALLPTHHWFLMLGHISNCLVILGISMPFYIYLISSKQFRNSIVRQIGATGGDHRPMSMQLAALKPTHMLDDSGSVRFKFHRPSTATSVHTRRITAGKCNLRHANIDDSDDDSV